MQPANRNTDPEANRIQTSLDRCLVDGDSPNAASSRLTRRKALGISFALETAALAVLIIAPLLTSVAQPNFSRSAFVPVAFNGSHEQRVMEHTANPTHLRLDRFRNVLTYPLGIRPPTPPAPEEADNEIPGDTSLMATGVPAPMPVMNLVPAGPPEPPRDENKKSVEKSPLKLSESVVQAELVSRINPRYPALALQIRLQGTVRLRAIISGDGRIISLEVLSGHPLLVQAALDAVRQWRFRPTLLDGEPVEVETSITVNFKMEP